MKKLCYLFLFLAFACSDDDNQTLEPDTIAPEITILGENPQTLNQFTDYVELGATALDNIDGDVSAAIQITSTVNMDVAGAYEATYSVSDIAGNEVSVIREVIVEEDTAPEITILGDNPQLLMQNTDYVELGATALDVIDGDITDAIVITSTVDMDLLGTYEVTYSVLDSAGNEVSAIREVIVEENPNSAINARFSKNFISETLDYCEQSYCGTRQLVFSNQNEGFVVSGVDLYKTIDSGENWEHLLNQDIVGDLIVISNDIMFLNIYDGVIKTINGGATWTTFNKPGPFTCPTTSFLNTGIVYFADEQNGFFQDHCDKEKLYKTNDSGLTWQLIHNFTSEIQQYSFIDANNGFVYADDILYLTSDGGVNFNVVTILPSAFSSVIEKDDHFLFPSGTENVPKPSIVDSNNTLEAYDTNDNGDIVVTINHQNNPINKWSLYLYESASSSWIFVDYLPDFDQAYSSYKSLQIVNDYTMFVGRSSSRDLLKYYEE
ncbi:DUF5011 domain-containing protein [Lacinutrix jangbogonensis]|uniref:DUF5011 domain-containing protein n=1 Tax=Lacinutrix jangbogonensis TaxID=1469557 RepID=UPI00053E587A|nr:DUF5011 domain-containing protein [Lacinutrix jangbogonensis]